MNSRRDISFWVGIRSSGECSTVGSLGGWPSSIPVSSSASRVFERESLSWLGSNVEASWAEGGSMSAMAVKSLRVAYRGGALRRSQIEMLFT